MINDVQILLLDWWRQNGRMLPWRRKNIPESIKNSIATELLREEAFAEYFAPELFRDPYRVVVAELMLQQTQVERVLPKYLAWMEKWPQIENLAAASLPEVLTDWQGLGYNRRARFLWLLAQEISLKRKGAWPNSEAELLSLPGIGPYTARAILSFAFGQQVGVVDTNVQRILERVFAFTGAAKAQFVFADQILPAGQADPWNQAMMDFGALICTARNPKCPACPLANVCQVNVQAKTEGWANYAEKLAQQKPVKKAKQVTPFKDTDRYFRGRILDELRKGAVEQSKLAKNLEENYGLVGQDRLQKLITKLASEQMIEVSGSQISLPTQ